MAGDEGAALANCLGPQRGAVQRELADHRLEGRADAALGGEVEGVLSFVVDHPQAHPIGIEQAAGPVRDIAQHRAEIQLSGQLTGDAGQGAGAGELTAGTGNGAGMSKGHARCRGGRAQEPSATADPRPVDIVRGQQHADPLLAEGQWQPDAAVGGDLLAVRRPGEGGRRRGAVTGMGLQHQPVVAHEIHRHPGDGLDRAQGLDRDPADGGHAAGIDRALRDAGEDGRLGVRVAAPGAGARRSVLLDRREPPPRPAGVRRPPVDSAGLRGD